MEIRAGRIEAVGGPGGDLPVFAIPGLRNAHCHLDLSEVGRPPGSGEGFARWVLGLVERRRGLDRRALAGAARVGASEALSTGTTAIADIDSTGASFQAVAESGLKGIGFFECLSSGGADAQVRSAEAWLAAVQAGPRQAAFRPGLSPHSPYSCSAELYQRLARLAKKEGLLLTTHIAETREELDFLLAGGGDLRTLLKRLGAVPPFDSPPGVPPIQYLDRLGCLGPGTLLAHANYPAEGDMDLLARSGATVVYCPRSHAFFCHEEHPVARYLEAGVNVALGTDSLASNTTLSMFDEMAFLRRARPDLSSAGVFDLATRSGAPLLDGGSGLLEPGQPADMVLVRSDSGLPASLAEALDQLTSGLVKVLATLVSGRICHVSNELEDGLLPLTWPRWELFSTSSDSCSGEAPGRLAGD
ncbi:MAG: amidohydrolase family protein [Planctomycetota bacterium]